MTCLLFRKGNKAKQFTLYFYLLQTGSRSKHLRQFVLSPSLSYNGRKESSKIACQCQEPWAFFFFKQKPYSNSSFWRDGSHPCQELCCISIAGTVYFLAWPHQLREGLLTVYQYQCFLHRWKWAASCLLCWLFLDDFQGFCVGNTESGHLKE